MRRCSVRDIGSRQGEVLLESWSVTKIVWSFRATADANPRENDFWVKPKKESSMRAEP